MQKYVWKKSVLQPHKTTVLKDVSSFRAIYYEFIGYKNTHDYLVAFLEELKTVIFKKKIPQRCHGP